MSIRIIICAVAALLLSSCYSKEPKAVVTPVTAEMEAEWHAE